MTDTVDPAAGETVEYVSIDDASEEDLDAYLEKASSVEFSKTTETQSAADVGLDEEQEQEEGTEGQSPEDKVTPEDEKDVLQKKLDKQVQHNKNLEQFINRQANEIGNLRKELQGSIQGRLERLESGELSRREEILEQSTLGKEQSALEELDVREAELSTTATNFQVVKAYLGETELPVSEIAEVFRLDGIPEEGIREFAANPYMVPGSTLVQAAKRAELLRDAKKIYAIATKLLEENKQLKVRTKKQPGEVLKKIDSALKTSPGLNGSTGGGSSQSKLSGKDINSMSDSELDAFLESAKV